MILQPNMVIEGKNIKKIEDIIDDYYTKLERLGSSMEIREIISAIYVYAETYEFLTEQNKWDHLIKEQLARVKESLEQGETGNGLALFGGLCDIGLAIYLFYKKTGNYLRFWQSINTLIVDCLKSLVIQYSKDMVSLKMQHYDCITGLSGVLNYLIHTDNKENIAVIESILQYLVNITNKKYINGQWVLGWHINRENQFRPDEREKYINGNFNFGMSHGIAGPLAVLSIAYIGGYQVKGQREAIVTITEEYRKLASYDRGYVLWPGQYSFENYILGKRTFVDNDNRMSWCYGTIGILRALKLAGMALDCSGLLAWHKRQIHNIACMDLEGYLLQSPTICHGYAGLMALFVLEYKECQETAIKTKIHELLNCILNAYHHEFPFGFKNIETVYQDGKFHKTEAYGNFFLDGAAGIILALVSLVKDTTEWETHLLGK